MSAVFLNFFWALWYTQNGVPVDPLVTTLKSVAISKEVEIILITFKSVKIENALRLNRYNVEGVLTIKGISKTVKFELITSEKGNNIELKCNFEINRKNYNVGGSSLILSNNVKLNLIILATKMN